MHDEGIGLPIVSEFGVESSNGFVDLIPANGSRALRSFFELICQTRQTALGLRSRAAVCIIGAREIINSGLVLIIIY